MGNTYVTSVSIDGKINSFGATPNPYFSWNFFSPDGLLTGYEIRIAQPDPITHEAPAELGTDSLVGDIWHPGRRRTPEAYGVRFNDDGTAFGGPLGCLEPKYLQPGVIYYFQLQILDDQSDWFTGFFSLEIPPTASNVLILPAAPYSNDELFATYDFAANPGKSEDSDKTRITWYRQQWPKGTFLATMPTYANQKTIPAGVAKHGDMWQFTVRPHDGQEYSVATYGSQVVTIGNHPPSATALAIKPGMPKTSDNLEATFFLADPDGDAVTTTIRWYRDNGFGFMEQVAFLNSIVVPASSVSLNDTWYFTVLPNDGYENGNLAISAPITVTSTPPYPTSISVDGALMPTSLNDPNPVISWTYQDNDGQPQQQYQMVIGTRPISVNAAGTSASAYSQQFYGGNGIFSSTGSDGVVVAGNDVYDSGVMTSGDSFFSYSTVDFLQTIAMTANSFDVFSNYAVLPDQVTMALTMGSSSGLVVGQFNGRTSFYDVALTYVKEKDNNATYKLIVDNVIVGQFNSFYGSGLETYTFGSVMIESGSTVGIAGAVLNGSSEARVQGLSLKPTGQITVMAGDFDILSGYLNDGLGGIKLAGLAGTASTKFAYPSGTYNIELVYVTETNGNPTLTLSVNSTMLMNFAYEGGAETRSRFIAGVRINQGDTIKISGTRNAGAAARVKEIMFKPVETSQTGAQLRAGFTYYASLRLFDGNGWGNWYTTMFAMGGSAWAASVSNATGWTIETMMQVVPNS